MKRVIVVLVAVVLALSILSAGDNESNNRKKGSFTTTHDTMFVSNSFSGKTVMFDVTWVSGDTGFVAVNADTSQRQRWAILPNTSFCTPVPVVGVKYFRLWSNSTTVMNFQFQYIGTN